MMSIEELTSVRPAEVDDRPALVGALAAAFLTDPVFEWMVPEAAMRQTLLPDWFTLWAAAYERHEQTYVVGGATVEGAALWAPPGVEPLDADDDAAFGAQVADLPSDMLERFATCGEMLGATHPEEPNWYLHFLGVDPTYQGRGHGSTMLHRVLSVADERGEPAYLDATSPRNRALYERHGFHCIADNHLPSGPTVYAMWREPQS